MAVSTIKTPCETYRDTTSGATFCKVGRVVTCSVPQVSTQTIAGWTTYKIADIPEGFRPYVNSWFPIVRQSATNAIPVFLGAYEQGILALSNQSSTQYTTGAVMRTVVSWATN